MMRQRRSAVTRGEAEQIDEDHFKDEDPLAHLEAREEAKFGAAERKSPPLYRIQSSSRQRPCSE